MGRAEGAGQIVTRGQSRRNQDQRVNHTAAPQLLTGEDGEACSPAISKQVHGRAWMGSLESQELPGELRRLVTVAAQPHQIGEHLPGQTALPDVHNRTDRRFRSAPYTTNQQRKPLKPTHAVENEQHLPVDRADDLGHALPETLPEAKRENADAIQDETHERSATRMDRLDTRGTALFPFGALADQAGEHFGAFQGLQKSYV